LIAAFPGAITSTSPVQTQVKLGDIAEAGSFTVENTTSESITLAQVTINESNPSVFSFLRASATVGSGKSQIATGPSGKADKLVFTTPVTIASMETATCLVTGYTGSTIPGWTFHSGDSDSSSGSASALLALAAFVLLAVMWSFRARPRTGYAFGVVLI